jgi:hypothetical protein
MIRREIKAMDGSQIWLFVSQVGHAHLSGELMRHWKEKLPTEVVEGIAHHDDGWADWELEPKLKTELGAPYSFLEMPLEDSLSIWDKSIEAARKLGPLAGWIVGGHFYNLLADSENAREPKAIAWLTSKRKARTKWLDEWVRAEKPTSLEPAKHAQQILLLGDLFSLWLCCDCLVDAADASILRDSPMKGRTDSLLAQFQFESPDCVVRESVSMNRIEGLIWTVPVAPFPFDTSPLLVAADAQAAPVQQYASWNDVRKASWPVQLEWRLTRAVSDRVAIQ